MKFNKSIIRLSALLLLAPFIAACDDDEAATPHAGMVVDKTELGINETMTINFEGVADQVAIYTGDESHNYELRSESNTGFVVNKGLFTYSYSAPGTYKVVCIASTYNDLAVDLRQDTCSVWVRVIDDETEIRQLSCPQILYDEVYADALNASDWVMRLPRKVKYRNATPTISLTQRLRFYIDSDSTQVYVGGEPYGTTTRYDLSQTQDITVVSHFGTIRDYKLYTVQYPEFDEFRVNGVEGELDRSEFDYSAFTYTVTLPAGTDVSNVVPEFTLTGTNERAYIGDVEQTSGVSTVDLSQPVTYKLVGVSPDNAEATAESTITVNVNFE